MYIDKYHIYFVGISGIGMSGIAELLLNLGYRVSGSDIRSTEITKRLEKLGATVYKGHKKENISNVNVVVISSAIKPDNPEVVAAKKISVPVIPRAEMLAELMRLKYSIAVAGAHGKTTTTSIIASVLGEGKLDPTIVIGGKLKSIGTNALLGGGEFIVAEADESDGSFLKYSPAIAVVTNIDREHLDFYKDIDEIKKVFLQFINSIPFYGLCAICLDNEYVQSIIPFIKKRFVTYGISTQADFKAKDIKCIGTKSEFSVFHQNKKLGRVSLNLPGIHNVNNALASIVVGVELKIPFDVIKKALETIDGVDRRMEVKGELNGIMVIDDYGHHPTEIKTTLDAIKSCYPDRRSVVVFQPHRYTRTKALFKEFTKAFYQSDLLVVLPVYAAGEKPIDGVNGNLLCQEIILHGHKDACYVKDFKSALKYLISNLKKDDILLTLGAGDVWKIGDNILEALS